MDTFGGFSLPGISPLEIPTTYTHLRRSGSLKHVPSMRIRPSTDEIEHNSHRRTWCGHGSAPTSFSSLGNENGSTEETGQLGRDTGLCRWMCIWSQTALLGRPDTVSSGKSVPPRERAARPQEKRPCQPARGQRRRPCSVRSDNLQSSGTCPLGVEEPALGLLGQVY